MQYSPSVFPEFIFTLVFQDPTQSYSSATCCPSCFVLFVCLLLLFTCLFGFCLPSIFCASLCFWRVFFFPSASAVLIFLRLPGPCHTGNVEGVPWTKIKGQLPALPQRPQCCFLRHAHQEGTCKEPQTTELLPGDTHWNNWLPADSSALKELTTLKMDSKILP